MSEYLTVKTQLRREHSAEIVQALEDVNPAWTGLIEVHATPVGLIDYRGNRKGQVAHVVIRRQHIGSASNDIGFEFLPDGTVRVHISDYDRGYTMRYDAEWLRRVTQHYSYRCGEKYARKAGLDIVKTQESDGSWRVEMTKKSRAAVALGTGRIW